MKKITFFFSFLLLSFYTNAQVLDESFDAVAIPTGWTQEYVSGTDDWAGTTANGNSSIVPRTGSHMAEFRNGNSGSSTKLVTPSMDLSGLTSPQLTFYYANVNWFGDVDELRVYYKTSAAGAWTQLGADYDAEQTDWTEVTLILPSASADYYLAFEATSEWARGMNLDDVSVAEAPSCLAPTALTATSITITDAVLGWTEAGTASLYNVEVVAAGTTPTGTATDTGVVNGFTKMGLTATTDYEFYVQADCSGVDISTWSGPYSFSTYGDCASSGSFSYGNNNDVSNSLNGFIANTSGDYITLTFTAGSTEVGWDYWFITDSADGAGNVLATGDGSIVGSYESTTGEISFYVNSDGGTTGNTFEYSLSCAAPPSCPSPTALFASNISASSADLAWTIGDAETLWNVEVVAAGTTPTGTATDTGVANPFNKTGLTANTDYEFYVQADCGATDGVSPWTGPFAFTTLCDPISTFPWTEDYETTTGTDLPICWSENNNNADGDSWKSYATYGVGGTRAAGMYTDFNNGNNDDYLILPQFTLTGGERLKYSVRARSAGEPNDYKVVLSTTGNAAADFTVDLMALTTVSSETYNEEIIDLSTYSGNVYIAIHVPSGGLDGWYIYFDNFTVEPVPSCFNPTALAASTITATTAELAWTESGTASLYNVEVVTAGTTPTGTATDTGVANPFNKTGLTANTDYEFYVQADCGATDGVSPWTGPFAFTTSCAAISTFPSATDFTNNTPTNCWGESGSGEVTDGPTGSTSDWRENRAYLNAAGDTVNSNALNLYQSVDREWLVSPTYTIPSGTPHGLLVQVAVTNWGFSSTPTTVGDTMGSDDEVKLLMTVDNGATWTTLTTWNVGNQPSVSGTDYLADLTAVTGDVKFALWGSDGTTDDLEDYDFHVGVFRIDTMAGLSTDSFETNNFSFKFYPNPVENNLTINSKTEISSIEVFNVLGQTVLKSSPNTNNTKLNMSQLNSGAYFVKVVSGNSAKTIRIIKN